MKTTSLLALTFGGLLTATAALAQTPSGPAGTWQGSLKLPSGDLQTVFTLAGTPAALSGTLSVPQQGLKDMAITRVQLRADSLYLTLTPLEARFIGRFSPDQQQVSGLWQQGGAEMPLTLTRGAAPAKAALRRPQTPQAPFPYQSQEVSFTNAKAKLNLAGTLTLPKGKGRFPAVVLVSGSGPQDRNESILGHQPFLVLADYLTRQGFAVLRYDDRGTAQSGGTFAGATTADFTTDAQAALAYLRTRPDIKPDQVALIGHSEGGLIAWQTAAQPGGPNLVVTLAGPGLAGDAVLLRQQQDIGRAQGMDTASLGEMRRVNGALFAELRRQPASTSTEALTKLLASRVQQLQPQVSAEEALKGVAPLTGPWMRYFLTTDVATYLQKVKVPVLALNGAKDTQVAAAENLQAIEQGLKAAHNRDVTVRTLPGLNHLFQTANTGAPQEYVGLEETFAPAALEAVGSWLKTHTSGK
ncbi:alpha/beta fold hydrolase [Hymenobacter lutimineralis]|uniref:Alpha/beta fold hydrolase n=1 Tax=Hymenobacter lutimineralis TaxID=2606448 RepID=A0A5D6VIK0_9BACT|nr:alpha/beta fold hydrolase [Hymenobacter lutimineralis]TYZ14528.1 alpha/beta fold hydrolase [Hymenobacter lutimineralis]